MKLRELVSLFGKDYLDGEILIAPRPIPKQRFKYYWAFAAVEGGSRNEKLCEMISNHRAITQAEFKALVAQVDHAWVAGDRSMVPAHLSGK